MSSVCEACQEKAASQKHHRFSQTKWARKYYGKLLDHPSNIMAVCVDCHSSHASPNLEHWTERQFCEALDIEMRSKIGRKHGLKD
jgi:hypothetical protein